MSEGVKKRDKREIHKVIGNKISILPEVRQLDILTKDK